MIRTPLAALAVSALLCSPALAARPLGATGVLMGHAGTAAPPAYDPGGVLFWNETGATNATGNFNGGANTRHGIVAFRRQLWIGTPGNLGGTTAFRSSANFGITGTGSAGCSLEGCLGWMINADSASWVTQGVGFTLRNTLSAADTSPIGDSLQGLDYAFDYQWQSVVSIYDTNHAQNSRIVATWVDGVYKGSYTDTQGAVGAYDVPWNDGVGRGPCINDCQRGSGIATGGALLLSDVIVDTANALPANCPANAATGACDAIVAAYYSSGPVSPGTTSTNCNTFRASYSASVQTDWCLRGGKSTFLANTDGTANVLSVLTEVASTTRTTGNNQVKLYDAAYGQGAEPTDRPYFAWAAPFSTNVVSTSTTSSCTGTKCETNVTGNFGGKIIAGDRIFVAWEDCHTSTSPSATLPTLSGSWTFVPSSTNTNPTLDVGSSPRCIWLVATRVAPADIIGVNRDWVAGNPTEDPLIVTYTTTGVQPLQVGFIMFVYRSTNATVNIDTSDFVNINMVGGAGAPLTTPTVTTTKATTTLVSLCMSKSTARPTNPPTTEDLRIAQPFSASGVPIITLGDEKLTSSGSTGTRTYIQSGTTTTGERAYCGLIALKNS